MAKKPQKKKDDGSFGEQWGSNVVRSAFIDGATFYSKEVQYAEVEGLAIFEGDIVLGTVEAVKAKTELRRQELRGEIAHGVVITGAQFRWPNCLIPYTIDSSLPNQARVTDAIAHWEANTRVRFILRTAANAAQYPDYVTFRPGSGCSSWVGRQGNQQFITLASGCTTGNTIHEIGHAVGLWHEQSRQDRNAFVTINWDKIISGYEHNFNQHIADGDDVGAYDYDSIMHYPRVAFSTDGSETITPTNPVAVIGQRNGLSAGDIAAANSLCPAPICPPAPIVSCAPGPKIACPPSPTTTFCPPSPRIACPPAPRMYCPPGPLVPCPPAPRMYCPPAPRMYCPPAPKVISCPPAPRQGCLAGPYMRPGPIIPGRINPTIRYDYGQGYADPYSYDYGQGYNDPYAYDYGQGYADPYGYNYGQNWAATEYADPNESYCCEGYDWQGNFDPWYRR